MAVTPPGDAYTAIGFLCPCCGEIGGVPQDAEWLACGTPRKVSLAELRDGTAPLYWTCPHGIRPDEPHRI